MNNSWKEQNIRVSYCGQYVELHFSDHTEIRLTAEQAANLGYQITKCAGHASGSSIEAHVRKLVP